MWHASSTKSCYRRHVKYKLIKDNRLKPSAKAEIEKRDTSTHQLRAKHKKQSILINKAKAMHNNVC